ncbi:MAG TPA: peptidoglycan-binding domain-containing protein [Pyrinomonadaceae bacterium]|jgi:hypothetical protein
MKRKRQILTAALLSASVGLGAQSVLAQTAPGSGPVGPTNPTGPVVPQPEPNLPRETQPTIPGQPAPGIPQPDRMPGQPGTIPERVQRPSTGERNMVVTPDDIKKAQDALKAKGLNPGTDGRMDAKTQQALREFQKSNNLPATGVLDDKTAEKLGVSKSKNPDFIPERGSSSNRPDSSLPKSDRSPQ